MQYRYLKGRGALNEAAAPVPPTAHATRPTADLTALQVSPEAVELVPEAVARENLVMPLTFDGETITAAAVNPADVMLADKLRFILNKNVRLVPASREAIIAAINEHYGQAETESVDSYLQEFTDTAIDFTQTEAKPSFGKRVKRAISALRPSQIGRSLGKGIVDLKKDVSGWEDHSRPPGLDLTSPLGGSGMFFYTVEEGQRALMRRPNGTMEVIVGPRRVWRWRNTFTPMQHYIAHPGEFLIVRYRDGRQEHLPGPAELWLDPRIHQEIVREEALQLAAKEAVVVYSKTPGSETIARRIETGPSLFVPKPGEWLHTFSWHASKGGHLGLQKVPNGLVFQKLWLMPDQMYHDVPDVRTADDALLTIRLMIFFELVDIERMLDTTHDPIGDFVNATTSDVIECVGKQDFESFKRNTDKLNELETYRQLTGRATQCGYRINKVVYRGYGAPAALQQMHDQAIQARTRLQLDRATEQQAQDLEDYKLDCQIARASKRRTEQATEVEHDLAQARKRQEAELQQREAQQTLFREQRRLEAETQLDVRKKQDAQQREQLAALRDLGVDLTAYLTQARADRVIELRGAERAHVHLAQEQIERDGGKGKS
jgi:hypothetical protein